MVPTPPWAGHPLLLKRKGGLERGVQGESARGPPLVDRGRRAGRGLLPAGRALTVTNMASRLALLPRGAAQLSCSLARLMPVAQCSSSSWL